MKKLRDENRRIYFEENNIQIKDCSGVRKGYTGANSSQGINNPPMSSTSSSSEDGISSSINSDLIQSAYFNATTYLKTTQSGLDGFFAIGRYPINIDGDGETRTYGNVGGIEVRYTSSYVYDGTSFETAWNNASTYFSSGSLDAYSGDVKQNYWQWSPTLSSGNNYQQLIKITFCNSTGSGSWRWQGWWSYTSQIYLNTLSSPTITFNQSTNYFSLSNVTSGSARAIEFRRDNYSPYSSYLTSVEKDICYNSSVRNYEWGIYDGQINVVWSPFYYFSLWDVGTYTVKLSYASAHPSGTRTRFSNAVNSWISQMNGAISGSGISFVRNDSDSFPDILIETKSNADMGSSSGYTYGGLWENTTDSNGWIYEAYIRINYETNLYDGLWSSVEHIMMEELTEACGCGGDLTTRADCINTDFNWYGKVTSTFGTIDYNIQRFLYVSNIHIAVGLGSQNLAVLMNPSNGFISTTGTTASAYYLAENVTYNMRVWQASTSDAYSVVPAYSATFTPTNYPTIPNSAPLAGSPPRVNAGLNITWGTSSNADYYEVRYKNYNNVYYTKNLIYGTSTQLTGLEYGVTYYISARSKSSYGKPPSGYTTENSFTTAPKLPTISVGSVTTTSAVVSISGMAGNWNKVVVQYKVSGSGTWSTADIINPSSSVTLTGLSSGTAYDISVYSSFTVNTVELKSVDSSGNYSYATTTLYTQLSPPSSPTFNGSRVDGGLPLMWGSVTNATSYTLRYSADGTTYTTMTNTTNTYQTITGLSYGKTYYVSVRANGTTYPTSAYSSNNTATTAPKIPTISASNITISSVDISASGMSGTWSYIRVWYRLQGSSDNWSYITINAENTPTTISSLAGATSYEIKASSFLTASPSDIESRDSSGNIGYSSILYITTANPRPSNFNWTTTITQNGLTYGMNFTNKSIYIVSASEWNSLTSKINQFRQYKGLANYTFTNVSTNTSFTASIFNEARTAILAMSPPTSLPSSKSSGNVIMASDLIGLKNSLNSIP